MVVLVWALKKVTDLNGNYFTVTYHNDITNGEYYPQQIDYTGNDHSTPALQTQRQVFFAYEDRTDKISQYTADSLHSRTVRLKNIQTKLDGAIVKQYHITYDYSPATSRSRRSCPR